ncbi:hypothetical protein PR202_ga10331 [Eleusine coracana subsp. coracana]|uniref:BTB domain-containing protein n=1 Tax=Eleusine coracana subsp. coracana TaxID=191504 RepID=A0AAV5C6D4_ELECO|nr:hypothetical protein PR202_ga10331 [Eleusine coracana subsp. coracana]
MQSPEPSSSSPVLLNIGRFFLPPRIHCRVPFPFPFGRELEAASRFPCCDCDTGVRDDAGGKKYATTVETLTQREPDSMLAAMFSGRHTLPHEPTTGMVFVDRDGKHFRHVLNWLRDGAIPVMSESKYQQLLREAEYYQLLDLSEVDFSYACIKNTDFSCANLYKAKFGEPSNLERHYLFLCILLFFKLDFQTANLAGANLKGANLEAANLKGAKLYGTNLQDANLQRAYLREVDLRGTLLTGAKLGGANLLGAIR